MFEEMYGHYWYFVEYFGEVAYWVLKRLDWKYIEVKHRLLTQQSVAGLIAAKILRLDRLELAIVFLAVLVESLTWRPQRKTVVRVWFAAT